MAAARAEHPLFKCLSLSLLPHFNHSSTFFLLNDLEALVVPAPSEHLHFLDRIPVARRYTGHPAGLTLLQRMGVGRLLAVPAMGAAALVETWRLRRVRAGGNLSIGWQLPQFVILACSDVFCGIAQLEFFYAEAPTSMRSLCSAFQFLAMSLAYYVNTLVVSVVAAATTAGGRPGWLPVHLNDGHLDYYFWLWTGISAVNYAVYTAFAKRYTLKKVVRQ